MTMTGGHKMKNRKIQEQLLIWFLIFTVIPLSVISSWCYLLASRIINQKSSSYAAESIQQLSDNLDQLLVQIENTSLSISYNNYIQNALENLSNGQSISRVDSYQLEKNMILTYDYASMRDITIRPAASIKDNNTLFRVPARLDPDTEDLFYPASDLTDIYDITWRGDTRQQIIQMIRPIESTRNFHHMGILYISLYSSYIDNLVKNIHFDEKGFALILDSKNQPINIKEVDPSLQILILFLPAQMDVLTVRSALWIMSIFILLLLRPAGNPWGSFQFLTCMPRYENWLFLLLQAYF